MESNTKKINKLDLSAHAYKVIHRTLPDEIKQIIENIKLKYKFHGDLHQLLIGLPSWLISFKDIQRQKGRAKTKKALLEKTMKSAEKLEEYLRCFSGEMRNNMRSDKNKDNPFDYFVDIEKNLPHLIQKCLIEISKIPTDIGGQNGGSIPKSMLWYLIQQYEYHTQSEATCGWIDEENSHTGEFYYFVLDIKPILQELEINLGKDTSIGQYTRELLTDRNNKRNELVALIITIILNKELLSLNYRYIADFWLYFSFHQLHHLKSPRFTY